MPTLIVAIGPNGIIGLNGGIPWKSSADLKRFKATTMGGNLIMGRKTWESIGRPLPGRRHAVVTRDPQAIKDKWSHFLEVGFFPTYQAALESFGFHSNPTFVVGGAEIYREALAQADPMLGLEDLDITTVDVQVLAPEGSAVVLMPPIPFHLYSLVGETKNPDDPRLTHRVYQRISKKWSLTPFPLVS